MKLLKDTGTNILKGIEINGLSLYLKKHGALVISDIHIGYEEALNKQGFLIPRFSFRDMKKSLKKILKPFKMIIINGDLKHEFGTISRQEWNETIEFIDLLLEYTKELVLIKGNHDTILKPILSKRNLSIKDYILLDRILIIHGHIIPPGHVMNKTETIIIGHEHPAVTIRENFRTERYKCFLKGKFKQKNLIVMPSFNPIFTGTDVLKERTISPFLKQDLGDFDVYIVDDRVYYFGKLRDL